MLNDRKIFSVFSLFEAFDGTAHFGNGFYELKTVFVLRQRSPLDSRSFVRKSSYSKQEMKIFETKSLKLHACRQTRRSHQH